MPHRVLGRNSKAYRVTVSGSIYLNSSPSRHWRKMRTTISTCPKRYRASPAPASISTHQTRAADPAGRNSRRKAVAATIVKQPNTRSTAQNGTTAPRGGGVSSDIWSSSDEYPHLAHHALPPTSFKSPRHFGQYCLTRGGSGRG